MSKLWTVHRLSIALLLLSTGISKAASNYGINFDGVNDYVTFGQAPGLGGSNFTIECWFKRTGPGVATTTGSGGVTAVPLVSKGRSETDGDNHDLNYFLGIHSVSNVLVADFEEGAGQPTPGLNHPVIGRTVLASNVWYSAAATCDGTNFCLFLNGVLEAKLYVGRLPRSDSIQHAAVGSALNSAGAPSGYFKGAIDEVRIWNRAFDCAEICNKMCLQGPWDVGLVGCWSLNEGSGTVAVNGVSGPNGALTNGPTWVTGSPFDIPEAFPVDGGLSFSGTDHVTFGPVVGTGGLGLSTFTLETLFKRKGPGTSASTGSGGVVAIPLIAKGRGEADGDNRDMNYFLGIRESDGVLVADFEEGNTGLPGNTPGLNHPVVGTTVVQSNIWYHAAATYDGTNFLLYLDGKVEASLVVGQPPRADSIQHASLGTAIDSLGAVQGHFFGVLDEVRIWDHARNGGEILGEMVHKVGIMPGLCGKWSLNETNGAKVMDAAQRLGGNIVGANFAFVAAADEIPPVAVLQSPPDAATHWTRNPTLSAQINLPSPNPVTATFYGRARYASTPPEFTIVVIPDTQFEVNSTDGTSNNGNTTMFNQITSWINAKKAASNIVYVAHVGDCVQLGGVTAEYDVASGFMYSLESAFAGFPFGLPYGVAVGNHDQNPKDSAFPSTTTTTYNNYFGVSHFSPKAFSLGGYYAGHLGDTDQNGTLVENNDHHYDLFSVGGMDFVVIYLEFNAYTTAAERFTQNAALTWASSVLATYSRRKGIIVSHSILSNAGNLTPANGASGSGGTLYTALRTNSNLTLMLCGHSAQSRNTLAMIGGREVPIVCSDYQGNGRGGNGYLRYLRFQPALNRIAVSTYSPYQHLTIGHDDPGYPIYSRTPTTGATASEYFIPYDMHQPYDMQGESFAPIGSDIQVTTSGTISQTWPNLANSTVYEWYVAITDGTSPIATSTTLPRTFTTVETYTLLDLGTLGYGTSWGWGVNNLGQVAGYAAAGWGGYTYNHGIRTAANQPINPSTDDLGTPFTNSPLYALGINDAGWVVGNGTDPSGRTRAFLTPPGRPSIGADDLGTLGGFAASAIAINTAGQVVGFANLDQFTQHAFRTAAYAKIVSGNDLGTLSGQSYGNAINSAGYVVGGADPGNNGYQTHAFRADPDKTIPQSALPDLGTLGGAMSEGLGINDSRQIVGRSSPVPGQYYAHAFLAEPDKTIPQSASPDLGTFGGNTSGAYGINNAGRVVGGADTLTETHAFIKYPGNPILDLHETIPSGTGWLLYIGANINNRAGGGQIVGYGLLNGQTHGFLLTPNAP